MTIDKMPSFVVGDRVRWDGKMATVIVAPFNERGRTLARIEVDDFPWRCTFADVRDLFIDCGTDKPKVDG